MHTLIAGQFIVLASLLTPGLECPSFVRGDSNQDRRVDLADAIRTLDYLFEDGAALGIQLLLEGLRT